MNSKIPYYFILITCVVWLFFVYSKIEIPVDPGDGLMHYFISQASWSNPSLFLDNWGKPLFIFLSSPFAQIGYLGMFIFNVLVYLITCIIALKIFQRLAVNNLIAAIFPILFLSANEVAVTIFAGLTEPLFNLALILSFLFLIEKKYLLFAVIISLTPFLRSEGQMVFLLGIILLIFHRQYRIIAFLLIIPLIYFIIGFFALDDFWWYFTKSSYNYENNIYGHGSWIHYFEKREEYLGKYGLSIIVLSLFSILILFFNRLWNKIKFPELIFSYGIFFTIVFFHAYLWANGKYGSIGLTRITTQGMPLILIMALYYINTIFAVKVSSLKKILIVLFLGILIFNRLMEINNFTAKKPFASEIMEASLFLKKNTNQRIFCHHPLIAYYLETNPILKSKKVIFHTGIDFEKNLLKLFKKGDILVWDSQFGDREANLPCKRIMDSQTFKMVNEFVITNEIKEELGVKIFQNGNTKKTVIQKTVILKNQHFNIPKNKEFFNLYEKSSKRHEEFNFQIKSNSNSEHFLVCTNKNNSNYQARKLNAEFQSLNFKLIPGENYSFYIWNPSMENIQIDIKNFDSKLTIYPNLM